MNINVPDTIKGTTKANEEKSEAPKETTKQPETTLKPTSKPTEDAQSSQLRRKQMLIRLKLQKIPRRKKFRKL